jgi:hypothetical protein
MYCECECGSVHIPNPLLLSSSHPIASFSPIVIVHLLLSRRRFSVSAHPDPILRWTFVRPQRRERIEGIERIDWSILSAIAPLSSLPSESAIPGPIRIDSTSNKSAIAFLRFSLAYFLYILLHRIILWVPPSLSLFQSSQTSQMGSQGERLPHLTSSPTILFVLTKAATLQLKQDIILICLVLAQKILSPTLSSPMRLGQTTKATEIRLSFRNSPRDRALRFVCVPWSNPNPPPSSADDKLPLPSLPSLPFLRNREHQLTSCSLARLLRFSGPRNYPSRSRTRRCLRPP